MLTAAQCRAARGLLNWKQKDLAEYAGVTAVTIFNFEASKTSPHNSTVKILKETFEKAGVIFIDDNGGGVKLKG